MFQRRSPPLDLWKSDEGTLACEVPETPETNKFLSDQTIRIKSSDADRTLEESEVLEEGRTQGL